MAHSRKGLAKAVSIIHPSNNKLFITCVIFSVVHLGMMLDAFFTDRDHVAYAAIVLHGMLLVLYVGPKEANRWFNGGHPSTRPGEFLVFLWIVALGAMVVVNHFKTLYRIPEGMTDMVATLVAILFGSEMSKLVHGWKRPPCPSEGEDGGTKPEEPKTAP